MSRPVAQLAERRSPKPKVRGSIPRWPGVLGESLKDVIVTGLVIYKGFCYEI